MLKINNMSKAFLVNGNTSKPIFNEFNLSVNKGDFITIIGSNGAGKSTLLNIISGTVKQDIGDIYLNNREIGQLKEHMRMGEIGRVFQDPRAGTASSLTILENMALALNKGQKYGLKFNKTNKIEEKAVELLKILDMNLENRLNDSVELLSGGQRQAMTLLMSVAKMPRLLLLDEHTAALDPKISNSILKLTEKLIEKNNITALMVTHNLQDAIEMGNRLIMLHRGKVVLDIKDEEKKNMTKEKLLDRFKNADDMFSDVMVLS